MALLIDGKLEVGAHMGRELCNLTCLKHLFKSTEALNLGLVSFPQCETCVEQLYNINNMGLLSYILIHKKILQKKLRFFQSINQIYLPGKYYKKLK